MLRFRSRFSTGVAAIAVLVALYSAGWLFLANRVAAALDAFVAQEHAQGMALLSTGRTITGFPGWIEVDLTGIAASGLPHEPDGRLAIPVASAWARPWQLGAWRFALDKGATLDGPLGHARFGLMGGHVATVLGPGGAPGGDLVDLHLDTLDLGHGDRQLEIARAGMVLHLPPTPPVRHEEALFSLSVEAHRVTLPDPVAPLGQQMDHLRFEATWRGPVPPGRLTDALAAWRDQGGTVDLAGIDLGWGPLSAMADGTLALDKDMQPLGAFSARLVGVDAILDALIASGQIPQANASIARLGLSMMAQRGADGTPQLKTPVTVQDGAVYMGPAKLAKLARVEW